MVDFGGWDMPIHYGSQIEEHLKVREDVGMCDVSHMTVVDVSGGQAREYLRHLLCNDVNRLDENGKALYSGMLNEQGGILDDLIVYRNDPGYRVVVNCATRDKDLAWMEQVAASFDVSVDERPELGIVAVQGPASVGKLKEVMSDEHHALIDSLAPFTSAWCGQWLVARTGYTGEKGIEVILPGNEAADLWQSLAGVGVNPVGLGARDTLRLEAGMNLYGSDMDEEVTPYESAMGFTVVLDDHDFIGADRLRTQKGHVERRLVGLVMTERGVLRAHYPVCDDGEKIGEITSGAFSPTLQHSVALARIDRPASGALTVEIRGKQMPVTQVRPPFVRNGKQVYKTV